MILKFSHRQQFFSLLLLEPFCLPTHSLMSGLATTDTTMLSIGEADFFSVDGEEKKES